MNVFLTSTGRTLFINGSTNKGRAAFGDVDEFVLLYTELAKANPQHKFYLDATNKDNTPLPTNLIPMREDYSKFVKGKLVESDEYYTSYVDYFKSKGINIDKMIFAKQHTCGVIPIGRIKKLREEGYVKPLMSAAKFAPVVGMINSGVPYSIIMNDPREFIPMRDVKYFPEKVFTSYTRPIKFVKIEDEFEKSLNTEEKEIIPVYIDTLATVFGKSIDIISRNAPKSKGLFMFVNQAKGRYKVLEDYILPHFDCKIYGHWWERDYTDETKDRFEDTPISQMENEVYAHKYTFCLPVDKEHKYFTSSKFWQAIYYGMIPFFDDNIYDSDRRLPAHKLSIVHSGKELKQVIDMLESSPELYNEMWYYYNDLAKNIKGEEIIKKITQEVLI